MVARAEAGEFHRTLRWRLYVQSPRRTLASFSGAGQGTWRLRWTACVLENAAWATWATNRCCHRTFRRWAVQVCAWTAATWAACRSLSADPWWARQLKEPKSKLPRAKPLAPSDAFLNCSNSGLCSTGIICGDAAAVERTFDVGGLQLPRMCWAALEEKWSPLTVRPK